MASYWENASFWTRVQMSINVVGTTLQAILIASNAEHIWNYIFLGIQGLSSLLGVWFSDENKNGKVDVFEKEVTVKVTSDTPIEVKTSTETKTP